MREERRRKEGLESQKRSCCVTGGGEESWGTEIGSAPEPAPPPGPPVRTMRAGAELGRQEKASLDGPPLKERTRGRDTGLVGFLNSKPS